MSEKVGGYTDFPTLAMMGGKNPISAAALSDTHPWMQDSVCLIVDKSFKDVWVTKSWVFQFLFVKSGVHHYGSCIEPVIL